MPEFIDYNVTYQRITTTDNKLMLRVVMQTKEFGLMESRMLPEVKNEKINKRLLDSLADELIDAYEHRRDNRPLQVSVQ